MNTGNIKRTYEVFCFNPNEDIETIAKGRGWSKAQQDQKWLQVYQQVMWEAQKKRNQNLSTGIVHCVWNGDPPESTADAWEAASKDAPGLVRLCS